MTAGDLYIFALQAGMQYLIPAAVLLRALYFGVRGKLPEGLRDIAIAAVIAGLGALMDGDASDLGEALVEVIVNTLFVGALLTFILIYLLKLPNMGPWVDGLLGGLIGFVAWIAWVYILANPWPVWTGPLTAVAGAVIFIALRALIRQIPRLRRVARRLVIAGVVIVAIGGVIWLVTALG
jgi:hypothetical protein